MCAPLTVTCGCTPSSHKFHRPTHLLVLESLIVPCKNPGDRACKAGYGEPVEFQNSSTECAGSNAGFYPSSKEAKEICAETLKVYGAAVYRMHEKEFAKVKKGSNKGWFSGWL